MQLVDLNITLVVANVVEHRIRLALATPKINMTIRLALATPCHCSNVVIIIKLSSRTPRGRGGGFVGSWVYVTYELSLSLFSSSAFLYIAAS